MWLLAAKLYNAVLGFAILGGPGLELFHFVQFFCLCLLGTLWQTCIGFLSLYAALIFIAVWLSFTLCVGGRKQSRRTALYQLRLI